MNLRDRVVEVLRGPTAADLWRLRADLLEHGTPEEAPVWELIREFHYYLDELATRTSSRDYSELASKLDIGAVGGVVLEQIVEQESADELAMRILSGLVTEGLMIAATRQHVKAWTGELDSVYRAAAWYLYGAFWNWAARRKPGLSRAERRLLLDQLFAPLHDEQTRGPARGVLLGLLFQVLLASELSHVLGTAETSARHP